MDEYGIFELYGEKEMSLINRLKLDKCQVELFIKCDKRNQCFRNNKVQIRCDQQKQMLDFALNLLVNTEVKFTDEEYTQDYSTHLNWLAQLMRKTQIDALLRSKYSIEDNFTEKEPNKVEEVWSPKFISSYVCSDVKSSTVNLDLSLQSQRKSTVSSAERGKDTQEYTNFTVNFFQLAVISRNMPIIKLLIECIFDQCRKDIYEEKVDGQYIMRNLDLALNETVYSSDVNSYLKGMNALHLASFVRLAETNRISSEIDEGMDKLFEEVSEKVNNKKLFKEIHGKKYDWVGHVHAPIWAIYRSAVKRKTAKTKEIPKHIAQRFNWDDRYWKSDDLSNDGGFDCLRGMLRYKN